MFAMVAFGELLIVLTVIGLPVLCVTLCVLALILKGGSSKRHQKLESDETRFIQELHQSLNRLENRLDAIETILFENERQKERVK